jgi:hypothetical protein
MVVRISTFLSNGFAVNGKSSANSNHWLMSEETSGTRQKKSNRRQEEAMLILGSFGVPTGPGWGTHLHQSLLDRRKMAVGPTMKQTNDASALASCDHLMSGPAAAAEWICGLGLHCISRSSPAYIYSLGATLGSSCTSSICWVFHMCSACGASDLQNDPVFRMQVPSNDGRYALLEAIQ